MASFLSESNIELSDIQYFELILGYEHINCYKDDSLLGRKTKKDVVSYSRLKQALQRINPTIPEDQIDYAIEELTRSRISMSPVMANKEVYHLIRDGVPVEYEFEGKQEQGHVYSIDFNNPKNNDFLLVSQLWIEYWRMEGPQRRPDLILYVNGLPLVLIELKNAKENIQKGYDDNFTNYKRDIPQLFWYNAFCAVSNGIYTRLGSLTSSWEHYFTWLKIESEKETRTIDSIAKESLNQHKKISLQLFCEGLCEKYRFIDYFENFIIYSQNKYKIIAKNHQYHGVNNAVHSFENREGNKGKLGVFWHTQGSGKSYSMIFFCRKILRKIGGNFSFLIVTDRDDLDTQIWRNFHETDTINEKDDYRPSGREKLKEYLASNRRYVFSLIHKFGLVKGKQFKKITDRKDWIVIIDEAHRTQYKSLAENMRIGLPNAQYIAFTGTPLLQNELTRAWFGEYVSEYNFAQSIEDGATVPLFYNKRVPQVMVANENLDEEFSEILADENLTPEQQEKLEKEYSQMLHVIKREDRLREIARDIVKHFPYRLDSVDNDDKRYPMKAMVISVDKFTAVRMHDFVCQYIREEIRELRKRISLNKGSIEADKWEQAIRFMNETQLAVVISEEAEEEKKLAAEGLSIKKHRELFYSDPETGLNVEDYFKDEKHPLRIVFVCSMWLTGFDAPAVSTLYLDKPMQNHTLMQTIARANRVYANKKNGIVVDYYGVFRNLKKALASYAQGTLNADEKKEFPVKDMPHLYSMLNTAISDGMQWCKQLNVDLQKIINLGEKGFSEIALFSDYANILLANDDIKQQFRLYTNSIVSLYDSAKPEIYQFPDIKVKKEVFEYLCDIVDRNQDDIKLENARKRVNDLLDNSVISKGDLVKDPHEVYKIKKYSSIDLSKLDFNKLREEFRKREHKNIEFADLREFMEIKLMQMIRVNKTRGKFLERFKKIVEEYNSGSMTIEQAYKETTRLFEELTEEEKRAAQEGMTEEELELFDLLKKEKMTKEEEKQVKLAAKQLLQRLKEGKDKILRKDWEKDRRTRVIVQNQIRNILADYLPEPPTYDDSIFEEKVTLTFQHFYALAAEGRLTA
jgi:type I restriction enzyme R subunit